jgi:hypothetical protein
MQTAIIQQLEGSRDSALESSVEYLDCLTALAGELDRAMHSVAENSLPTFEDSVARQTALCSRLSSLITSQTGSRATASFADSSDEELSERINRATETLVTLNQRYSALLRHSGETLQMLLGLTRCYTGYTQQIGGVLTSQHTTVSTWSSQV